MNASDISTPTGGTKRCRAPDTPPTNLIHILNDMDRFHKKIGVGRSERRLGIDDSDDSDCMTYSAGASFYRVAQNSKRVPVQVSTTKADGSVVSETRTLIGCANPDCASDERHFTIDASAGALLCEECGAQQNRSSITSNEEERRTFSDSDQDHTRTSKDSHTVVSDGLLRRAAFVVSGGPRAPHAARLVEYLAKHDCAEAGKGEAEARLARLAGEMVETQRAVGSFVSSTRLQSTVEIERLAYELAVDFFGGRLLHDFKCEGGSNCCRNTTRRDPSVLAAALVFVSLGKNKHDAAMLSHDVVSILTKEGGVRPAEAGPQFRAAVKSILLLTKPPFPCASGFDARTVPLQEYSDEEGGSSHTYIQSGLSAYVKVQELLDLPRAVAFRAHEIASDWVDRCGYVCHPETLVGCATIAAVEEVVGGTRRVVSAGQLGPQAVRGFSRVEGATYDAVGSATDVNPNTIKKHLSGMRLATVRGGVLHLVEEMERDGAVSVASAVKENALLKADIWRCLSSQTDALYRWTREFHPTVVSAVALLRAHEACGVDFAPFEASFWSAVRVLEGAQAVSIQQHVSRCKERYAMVKKKA